MVIFYIVRNQDVDSSKLMLITEISKETLRKEEFN